LFPAQIIGIPVAGVSDAREIEEIAVKADSCVEMDRSGSGSAAIAIRTHARKNDAPRSLNST
jgi:hypothetical protein